MRVNHLTIALFATMICSAVLADDGMELFEENCAVCHGGDAMGDDRIAPPVFAVKGHYMSAYPERASFVKAVTVWIKNPDPDFARMPGALRRFGEMAPLEVSDEDAGKIANFIYDNQFNRPGM